MTGWWYNWLMVATTQADGSPGETGRRPASALLELRAPFEMWLNIVGSPRGLAIPEAVPRHVLVLPGLAASDVSTRPLRRLLRRLGHHPHAWGLGRNVGPTQPIIAGLDHLLVDTVRRSGRRPVIIVGWSLGGLYGRFLAQRHPNLVEQVISLGSPINLDHRDPTRTDGWADEMDRRHRFAYHRGSVDLDSIPRPSTSVYTKTDGVVPWQTCLQSEDHQSENVEVWGSHCGLGVNMSVSHLIADRLAQEPGTWSPYRPGLPMSLLFP